MDNHARQSPRFLAVLAPEQLFGKGAVESSVRSSGTSLLFSGCWYFIPRRTERHTETLTGKPAD
jgi:hypothetical protein